MRTFPSCSRRAALVTGFGLLCTVVAGASDSRPARACGLETHSSRGVIKAIGEGRKVVQIAHEKIDGYRAAGTTAFEVRAPSQVADLHVGDVVTFSFTDDDGERLLDSIKKV